MTLLAEILKALIEIGFSIYRDVQAGQTTRWEPIIDLFPSELRSRVYHEAREADMENGLKNVLDEKP